MYAENEEVNSSEEKSEIIYKTSSEFIKNADNLFKQIASNTSFFLWKF